MKVVILHHHLNPGGVTSIIGSQIKALKSLNQNIEIIVLCGNNSSATKLDGVEIITDELLNYNLTVDSIHQRASSIEQLIREHLVKENILHCHNPNLGKNPALTTAIHSLALKGYKVVNHCHDFAEDRPANMKVLGQVASKTGQSLQVLLYPHLPNYHFIVLNSCDFNRLEKSEVPGGNVHLLHNPVFLKEADELNYEETRQKICRELDIIPSKMLITYPVRGIRRKNLGELLLLAILFEEQSLFIVTQAPKNPEELPGYNRWKEFSTNNHVNVKYEAGEKVSYVELIRISDFCITTSKREGFGMVFLEPWLAGTAVAGRELPCITEDLKKQGVMLPRLYSEIKIMTPEGLKDFAMMEIKEQEDYLKTMHHPGIREDLLRNNPFLATLFEPVASEVIHNNKSIIQNKFSASNYGKRLFAIYQEISG